jgi:NADP-dependent aldehyde dehydrogenase
VALVHAIQAAADLVAHPAIQAVGFTGSLDAGRALLKTIDAPTDPVLR